MQYICMHCQKEYLPEPHLIKCECGAGLWVKPEFSFSRKDIVQHDFTLWRYAKAYPLNRDDIQVTFNETITPLAPTDIDGIPVRVKMDSLIPSGSLRIVVQQWS